MPDFSWLNDYIPESEKISEQWDGFKTRWKTRRDKWQDRWTEVNDETGWLTVRKKKISDWLDQLSKSEAGSGFAQG